MGRQGGREELLGSSEWKLMTVFSSLKLSLAEVARVR